MAETLEVIRTGERVTLGRVDAGRGWNAEIVTVAGEEFAVVRLRDKGATESVERWFTPCGFCDPFWSGSKSWAAHVAAGVCFQCNGAGTRTHRDSEADAVKLVRNRLRARERADAKRTAEEDARVAAQAAYVAAHPAEVAALAEVNADYPPLPEGVENAYSFHDGATEYAWHQAHTAWVEKWGDYLTSLASQVQYRPLSERQTASVVDAVARAKADHEAQAAREAAQRFHGLPGEKVTAEGTVVFRTSYESQYGFVCLLVVTGHGEFEGVTFKISGTGKTLWETEKGDHVEVTATIKDHDVYEGTKQTVLTRAKVKVLTSA
jgi:hypothetical protein